jgi:replicative DNA helicase
MATAQTLSREEQIEYIITNNVVLWANKNFNWTARDYQVQVLQTAKKTKQLVLRLGRRLGKTEMMCILVLWHSYTQINKINPLEKKYNILIICPFNDQVDLIFDRLNQLIDSAPDYKNSVKRSIYHRIELTNGTVIKGMTAGSKSNSGAANTRGQRAELVVLDEVDYMGDSEITNILNLRNEAPEKVKFICASTPSGRRASYFKWCTGASTSYTAKVDEKDIDKKVVYLAKHRKSGGNGWVHFHAPSTVNKELLKVNEDTGITYIDQFKNELTEQRFEQEVMAGFGEEAGGVFNHVYLDKCFETGRLIGLTKYYNRMSYNEREEWKKRNTFNKKILGVDWDKVCAGPTLVGVQFNQQTNLFEVFYRRELPRTEFTYIDAVNEVIKVDKDIKFDWIYCDRGAGDVQYELLKKHGKENPDSGLQRKVIANQLAENISIIDPITNKRTKMPIKPTMINNTALIIEKVKLAMNPFDKKIKEQLEDYRIKRRTQNGSYVYEDGNDHIIDALSRALLGFAKQYDALFKMCLVTKLRIVPPLDSREPNTKRKQIEKKAKTSIYVAGLKQVSGDTLLPHEINMNPYDKRNSFKRSTTSRYKGSKMPRRKTF